MNADLIERNTVASRNGFFWEEYAQRMLPGIQWVGGLYDATFNGRPVDIKSCEAWYKRYDVPNVHRRAGRFTLDADQDAKLKAEGGAYFFVIHIGELVVNSFLLPASKVQFCQQVAWTTLLKVAGAV